MPAVRRPCAVHVRAERLIGPGLYYKLHGVHRPVTMKKSVIKRRKRVIPTSQEDADGDDGAVSGDAAEQPGHRPSGSRAERGSLNPDGSVNLGLRKRHEQYPLALLPEPVRSSQGSTPLQTSGDLTAYHASHTPHPVGFGGSLTDDNRLAPLTSISIMNDRQSSLSPASFLSPPRKRSFDSEFTASESGQEGMKRLSSIKSILNPAAGASPLANPSDDMLETLRPGRSPGGSAASASSPGNHSSASGITSRAPPAPADSAESERPRAERRAALQREAERMRQTLAAKERELAALED